ncbi:hypothetical protein ACLB1G_11100 [Oxalobacteraceae bacterium A2-2]
MKRLSITELDDVSGAGKNVKTVTLIGYVIEFFEGVYAGAKDTYHPPPQPEQQAK